MTRRSAGGRATAGSSAPRSDDRSDVLPSLRHRQPVAFWVALIGTVALLLTTFGSFLSAIL